MHPQKFSFKSRIASFKFAFRGIWFLLKEEHNSRIHLLAGSFAIAMGLILRIDLFEWSLLAIVTGMVFVTELLNSSLEKLADIVDHQWDEKIMRSKDYAAAAVLVAAVISVVVGGLIFIPKILNLF